MEEIHINQEKFIYRTIHRMIGTGGEVPSPGTQIGIRTIGLDLL